MQTQSSRRSAVGNFLATGSEAIGELTKARWRAGSAERTGASPTRPIRDRRQRLGLTPPNRIGTARRSQDWLYLADLADLSWRIRSRARPGWPGAAGTGAAGGGCTLVSEDIQEGLELGHGGGLGGLGAEPFLDGLLEPFHPRSGFLIVCLDDSPV